MGSYEHVGLRDGRILGRRGRPECDCRCRVGDRECSCLSRCGRPARSKKIPPHPPHSSTTVRVLARRPRDGSQAEEISVEGHDVARCTVRGQSGLLLSLSCRSQSGLPAGVGMVMSSSRATAGSSSFTRVSLVCELWKNTCVRMVAARDMMLCRSSRCGHVTGGLRCRPRRL